MIDRFFCTNLPNRTDRLEAVQNEFNRVQISVEILPAEEMTDQQRKDRQANPFGVPSELYGPLKNIHKIIMYNQPGTFCFFEDDVYFTIEKSLCEYLRPIWKKVPEDWGVLYLGCYLWVDTPVKQINSNLIQLNKFDRLNKIGGSHAIVLSKKAVEYMQTLTWEQWKISRCCDISIQQIIGEKFGLYSLYPMIAYQREDFSDLEERVSKRAWMIKHNERKIQKL